MVDDNDPFIGCCGECHSDQTYRHTAHQLSVGFDIFPCQYCGGRAMLMRKDERDGKLKSIDTERGLS